MTEEVLLFLNCRPGGLYVDGTLGMGGHASAILKGIEPDGMLVGIDQDEESLGLAQLHLAAFGKRAILVHDNFRNLVHVLNELQISAIDGLLLDLGLSSYLLEKSGRGFSFKSDEYLDMRMDKRSHLTAREIVNRFPQARLEQIIKDYGEESWARRIAQAIIRQREKGPLDTAAQLASVICFAIPRKFHSTNIHPATRSFQALRIAVNEELESLGSTLADAVKVLKPGGRICVISFHSLEDRIVKNKFLEMEKIGPEGEQPLLRRVTRKPVTASPDECAANPRARSAKLRAAERLAAQGGR